MVSVPIQPEADIDVVDIHEYLDIFFRRRRLIGLTMIIVIMLGAIFTITRRPKYESIAELVVTTTASPSASSSGGSDQQGDLSLLSDLQALTRSRNVDTQVEVMSSPDLLDEAFNKLGMKKQEKGFRVLEEQKDFKTITIPDWAWNVSNKKNTDVIRIKAESYDPDCAAILANSIAQTFLDRDRQANNQATKQAREYVEKEVKKTERQLTVANTKLAVFKKKSGLVSPDEQLLKIADYMAQLQMDRDSAQSDVKTTQSQITAISKQLAQQKQMVTSATSVQLNPEFSWTVGTIDSLYGQRAALLQEYTPKSKEVRKAEGQIADAQHQLSTVSQKIFQGEVTSRNPVRDQIVPQYALEIAANAAASAKLSVLDRIMAERKKQFLALPEQDRQLVEILTRVNIITQTYNLLSTKYYDLVINEQSALPNGLLVSRGRVPEKKASPSYPLYAALFILLGALVSAAAAVLAERIDTRIHDQMLPEKIIGSVPLGAIPNIEGQTGTRVRIGELEHNNAFLESFRILRNNIAFSSVDRELKVLAVTSPGRSAGKSTICVNLAIAMAMDGKRVLIVDGDLRRPSIHNWMNISREVGLTNVIQGLCPVDKAIFETGIERVWCLPSGPLPPNPTEFLNSQQSRRIFKELSGKYDMVIVDTPPATGLSDVQVISNLVDGVLMVVTINNTLRPYLHVAMRTLRQVGAPIIGFVLNRLELKRQGYGYYYNYYYYYDYDEETDELNRKKRRRKVARKGQENKK
jgi:capsular exopolysaccharide synthesis family protein